MLNLSNIFWLKFVSVVDAVIVVVVVVLHNEFL